MVGPARGGRVTTVTGVPQQPHTFYMGSTGGGVWKTTDAGQTWVNVSDPFFEAASMGAIDVADSDPNVVYAGTGSEGIRSNVSIGKGIYISRDAGKTWKHAGLREMGQIGSVAVHPTDPNTAFAAALGDPFRPTNQRGVYRTRDGGQTWRRVLFVSDSTGAVDVELQPGNPNVVYASMWRGERKPWTIISGAREGGVYKSTDGGDTWRKLTNGLPNELVGKSNVAVTAAMPSRVYVLMEAKPGSGLYRSDDAGETFQAVNTTTPGIITRPFYYTNLTADPTNPDVVYAGAEGFWRSTDGGRTFRTMPTPHGDNHDLWINPRDNDIWIQSNDGGANVTLNGGRTWSTQYNQPTGEFYQVYLDNQFPYRLYGAQQDNTTVITPSLPPGGRPDEWVQLWQAGPGCETGPIIPHPVNPDTVYGACKGQFSRMRLSSGQERQSWVGGQFLYGHNPRDLRFRFQRVAPFEISPFDPRVIYHGSQYVHRTRDEGTTWEIISPDLTANEPSKQVVPGTPITIDVTGEEYYSTLYVIRESPLERGVIWTGANDGPVAVTRDGGRTWNKMPTIGDMPAGARINSIDPSRHRRGTAYVAAYRYLLGDWAPYAYKTTDYGKTWRRLTTGTNGIPADFPVRVVREDPDREGLLYAGTEFGMFVSIDDGATWQPFQLDLPVTPINDIKVHRRDLVVATQGRAFWILDDLSPLHQMADQLASGRATLFRPREAVRWRYSLSSGERGDLVDPAAPQFPPGLAAIDYVLPADFAAGSVATLTISDSAGRVVRQISSAAPGDTVREPAEPGMRRPQMERVGTPRLPATAGAVNRFWWDLAHAGPWDTEARRSGRGGPMVAPGTYTVRLTAGADTATTRLVVRADPRTLRDGLTNRDLLAQEQHNLRVRDAVSDARLLLRRVRDTMSRSRFAADSPALRRLQDVERALATPTVRYSQPGLIDQLGYLYGMTTQADQKVPRDAAARYAELRAQLDALISSLEAAATAPGGAQ
ncbi:MAG: VPS10 domain-containing protein [Gemmatimonadaceae bacterium]